MKTIPLTQGLYALVDDQFYGMLMQWKWYALHSCQTYYAVRNGRAGEHKKGKLVFMHRVILGIPDNMGVDHRDGNGINNLLSNVRPATQAQNSRNKRKRNGTSSRFIGVKWYAPLQKWVAAVGLTTANGSHKVINLGYYAKEENAAFAYDVAVLSIAGEYAKTNFDCKTYVATDEDFI
jgi:hypothetical protein